MHNINDKFTILGIQISKTDLLASELEKKICRINNYIEKGKFKLAKNMAKRELGTVKEYELLNTKIEKYSEAF